MAIRGSYETPQRAHLSKKNFQQNEAVRVIDTLCSPLLSLSEDFLAIQKETEERSPFIFPQWLSSV